MHPVMPMAAAGMRIKSFMVILCTVKKLDVGCKV